MGLVILLFTLTALTSTVAIEMINLGLNLKKGADTQRAEIAFVNDTANSRQEFIRITRPNSAPNPSVLECVVQQSFYDKSLATELTRPLIFALMIAGYRFSTNDYSTAELIQESGPVLTLTKGEGPRKVTLSETEPETDYIGELAVPIGKLRYAKWQSSDSHIDQTQVYLLFQFNCTPKV